MDKRIIPLLIIIALGIWLNALATVFQPTPTFAFGETDVNITKVGGQSLPTAPFGTNGIPVIIYRPSAFNHLETAEIGEI